MCQGSIFPQINDITGVLLIFSADALSYWHMGQQYKDCVNMLINDKGVNIISVPPGVYTITSNIITYIKDCNYKFPK